MCASLGERPELVKQELRSRNFEWTSTVGVAKSYVTACSEIIHMPDALIGQVDFRCLIKANHKTHSAHRGSGHRTKVQSLRTGKYREGSGGAGEIRTPDTWFRKPMLYPSELQPLIKRLLHFYYNAPLDSSVGLSKKFSNSMISNEKDNNCEK